MEVCDEPLGDPKLVARIDELVRPPGIALQRVGRRQARLDRPYDGGANSGDVIIGRQERAVDDLGGFAGNDKVLRVHAVLGQVFDLNRPECTETHVKRHRNDIHALCTELVQELVREMKACRWRRDGSAVFCIDGLIPLAVGFFGVAFDVWRDRRQPDLINFVVEILIASLKNKPDGASA